jgi:hypothetical protein
VSLRGHPHVRSDIAGVATEGHPYNC